MSDTEERPKPATEDLRRSKRNKFHLNVIAVLSRRSPDFRRTINNSGSLSKSSFKTKSSNNVRRALKKPGDSAPVLEPIFPVLSADKNLLKIASSLPGEHCVSENGILPAKNSRLGDTEKTEQISQMKTIRCPRCLTTFKSNAGLGKHIKTCKKYVDPSGCIVLADSSSSLSESSLSSKTVTKAPPNSSNSNTRVKKENDSDSLEDVNELDDAMPVLTPECSLKPRKTKVITTGHMNITKSIQDKRRLKRPNDDDCALFDVKKALTLKLEIPPVPRIVIDSPVDKNPEQYFCSNCPYRTSDKNLLLLHEALHDTSGPRSYQCTFCSYSSFSPNALHFHLNLHAPDLSPNTAVILRKHIIANKRNGILNVEPFAPITSSVVQRMEQVQTQQQRLVSIIKRSSGDEHTHNKRIKTQLPLPTTKSYSCKKCSFQSERKENLIFHEELHGIGLLYACSHCDYSSNARSVRDFHMRNHHFETSMTIQATALAINVLKKKAKELYRRCNSVPAEAILNTEKQSYPGFDDDNVHPSSSTESN